MTDTAFFLPILWGFASLVALLSGCQTTAEPACPLPQGTNVERSFTHARGDLSRSECQFRFDAYFERLLDIAAGDPSPQNSERFSQFLVWANDQGIISKISAKEHYNRYFSAKFVSLPDDYSNCSYTCRKKQEIISNMKTELRDKDRGLLKVTGDKRKYAEANRLYDSVQTLLEATCKACDASG